MKFGVSVKPSSSRSEVLSYCEKDNLFTVALKSAPVDGKANIELEKLMSKYLGKKILVKIGKNSKKKIMESVE